MDASKWRQNSDSDLSSVDGSDLLAPVPVRSRHTSIRNIAIEQLSQFNDFDDYDDLPQQKDIKPAPVKKNRPKLMVKVWSADFDNDMAEQIPTTPAIRVEKTESGDLILGKFCIGEHGLQVLNEDGEKVVGTANSRRRVSITSRTDFAEVRTLGSGTHGIVVEALHIPSMTLVAIKMLSVNTTEHMKSVNSELHVLHQNLVKLKLVDDMLSDTDELPLSSNSTQMNDRIMSMLRVGSPFTAFASDEVGVESLDAIYGPSPRGNCESDGGMWGDMADRHTANSDTASAVKDAFLPEEVDATTRHVSQPESSINGPDGISAVNAPMCRGHIACHFDEPAAQIKEPALRQFSSSECSDGRCPHVLGMFDAFLDPASGMVNLVLEYMDGGSLQNIVDNGGCDNEGVLASIAYQMMVGLEFLHSNNQLHRDIKPGNILLNCEGSVKVADFGIAKVLTETSAHHEHNSFVGTIRYMAPERISNTSSGYSYPADVWSAGMSLLAVAKGCYPLDYSAPASDEGEVPKDIEFWDLVDYICDRPSPVPGPGFSDDFTDFIACCLRKIPEDRLTATQLLDHTFLKQRHSPVNYGESQLDLLSGGKPDGGIGRERISTLVSNAHCNVKEKALREGQQAKSVSPSSCADGEVEDTVPSLSSFRTSSTAQLLSKAKSKSKAQLAELVEDAVTSISRGNSRRNISREDREDSGCFAGYDSDDFGELESNVDEIISSLQHDVCTAENSFGVSDNGEYFSDRHAIIEIRLRHLRTILEKVQQKYAFVDSLNHSQIQALKQVSHTLPDASIGFQKQRSSNSCSSTGSASVTSSFLCDRMMLLPSVEGRGQIMWEKFARQLHLPYSAVMRLTREVVDVRYFKGT